MTDLEQQTLHALFRFSRDTRRISASTLAAALSCTPTRVARALVALERAGLVDASRARLTMLGLATAVRLGPAQGGPRLDLRREPPAMVTPRGERPVPVAAAPAPAPLALRASVGGDSAAASPLS